MRTKFGYKYQDTGCAWCPSCLSCPLPVCVEEEEGDFVALEAVLNDHGRQGLEDYKEVKK